ncbi:hypothetical protein ACTI_47440 [Actinoplanes sp. OR16]|uniref:hypothetical protein n=1 Tax=Actinoplanes sp. OR16 TaxID=946334 RepID=UPI000F7119D4|nr:hypothetical protein [Actinoplanes sp. OR16]BBH68059.1 hypothetical protein ACTI_47440 [Actinoplanes sp. OR16]
MIPFGTQLVGRTEKALSAILSRHLEGTGLDEAQWITLTLAVTGGARVSDDDRALWDRVRAANTTVTSQLWGDLPTADLEAAARVLNTVLDRAGQFAARATSA